MKQYRIYACHAQNGFEYVGSFSARTSSEPTWGFITQEEAKSHVQAFINRRNYSLALVVSGPVVIQVEL